MFLLSNMYVQRNYHFLIGTILHKWEPMVRNRLIHVPIKRNISFKTEPLMGTSVPQIN